MGPAAEVYCRLGHLGVTVEAVAHLIRHVRSLWAAVSLNHVVAYPLALLVDGSVEAVRERST